MKRFIKSFCLSAVVIAGALLLSACGGDKALINTKGKYTKYENLTKAEEALDGVNYDTFNKGYRMRLTMDLDSNLPEEVLDSEFPTGETKYDVSVLTLQSGKYEAAVELTQGKNYSKTYIKDDKVYVDEYSKIVTKYESITTAKKYSDVYDDDALGIVESMIGAEDTVGGANEVMTDFGTTLADKLVVEHSLSDKTDKIHLMIAGADMNKEIAESFSEMVAMLHTLGTDMKFDDFNCYIILEDNAFYGARVEYSVTLTQKDPETQKTYTSTVTINADMVSINSISFPKGLNDKNYPAKPALSA